MSEFAVALVAVRHSYSRWPQLLELEDARFRHLGPSVSCGGPSGASSRDELFSLATEKLFVVFSGVPKQSKKSLESYDSVLLRQSASSAACPLSRRGMLARVHIPVTVKMVPGASSKTTLPAQKSMRCAVAIATRPRLTK